MRLSMISRIIKDQVCVLRYNKQSLNEVDSGVARVIVLGGRNVDSHKCDFWHFTGKVLQNKVLILTII